VEQAVTWIKKFAMDLVRTGDLLTLMDWRRLFPTELMRGQLEARIAIGWGLALAMRFDETLELIDALQTELGRSEMAPATREAMACECDAIRAVTIALKDDSQTALTLAEACLQRTNDPWTANVASNVARFGYLKAADLKSFYATPWIPYSQTEDRLNLFASVYHRCLLGVAEFQQLRTQTAERHYTESMRLAEQYTGPDSTAAALPASLLALLRYEQGCLNEAEALVIDRRPLIAGAGMLECVLSAILTLARVAEWRGNFERARAMLERGEAHGYERGWGRLIASVLTERIRLDLAEGRHAEAGAHLEKLERLARDTATANLCARSDIQNYASLARAWVAAADNRLRESIDLLTSLRDAYESAQNHLAALRVGPHLAVTLFRADESARAIGVFREIASASAAAQIDQLILETGPQIGPLLHRTVEDLQRTNGNHQLSAYLQNTLSRWRERYQRDGGGDTAAAAADTLSTRERSILERVGQGRSNKEIAKELRISPETVKSHIKNIFSKLDVEKRAQAVARAQSLGLVTTPS
jgi:LuxR family maltose regulon positive regulatory protein